MHETKKNPRDQRRSSRSRTYGLPAADAGDRRRRHTGSTSLAATIFCDLAAAVVRDHRRRSIRGDLLPTPSGIDATDVRVRRRQPPRGDAEAADLRGETPTPPISEGRHRRSPRAGRFGPLCKLRRISSGMQNKSHQNAGQISSRLAMLVPLIVEHRSSCRL